MIILSHRGYWIDPVEKNTQVAFERSFSEGFGTETDIRDLDGILMISHDMPTYKKPSLRLEAFFEIYKKYNNPLPLALNIKADGLQSELMKQLTDFDITNYFVFDMSVPDGIQYLKADFNVFTRKSEYEIIPSFYDCSMGVWMDEFLGEWISESDISEVMKLQKKMCLVSPELHGRPFVDRWKSYKDICEILKYKELMICTDLPKQAREFFL